jgi:hypothetical protein
MRRSFELRTLLSYNFEVENGYVCMVDVFAELAGRRLGRNRFSSAPSTRHGCRRVAASMRNHFFA